MIWIGAKDTPVQASYEGTDGSPLTLPTQYVDPTAAFSRCASIHIGTGLVITPDCTSTETEVLCQKPSGKSLITA